MKFIYNLVVKILFILLVFTSLHQVQIRAIELNNAEASISIERKNNIAANKYSKNNSEEVQLPTIGIFMTGSGL